MKRIFFIVVLIINVLIFSIHTPIYSEAKEKISKILLRSDALFAEEQMHLEEGIEVEDGLSFDEAYQLALFNSIEYKKAKLELENAKLQFEQVKDLKKLDPTDQFPYVDSTGNMIMVSNPDQKLQMTIGKEITYYQAKNAIAMAEKRIELEKQNLYHQVMDQMIVYAKAHEGLKLATLNAERAEKLYHMAESQYGLGVADKSSFLDSKVAYSQAKIGLENAKIQLQIAKENLFVTLGLNVEGELPIEQIQPIETEETFPLEKLDSLVAFASKHRMDYLLQQDKTNFEKKRFEIYDEHYTYYGNKKDKIRMQELVYEKEKLNLLKMDRTIYMQLYQGVIGLNQAVRQLAVLESHVEQAKESLRLAELRYEAGLSTTIEVISAQAGLTQAENNLLDGKYQIMTMKNSLEAALGGTISEYKEDLKEEEKFISNPLL